MHAHAMHLLTAARVCCTGLFLRAAECRGHLPVRNRRRRAAGLPKWTAKADKAKAYVDEGRYV